MGITSLLRDMKKSAIFATTALYRISANYEIRDYLATAKKIETKNFEIDVHGLLDQES